MILLQSGKIPLAGGKTEPLRCSLCPTMDLISFAGGGQAHVLTYRSIDWEKLFNATCPESSGALAWRPDGKELAVGTSTGKIILLKTETGSERESSAEYQQTSSSRITCLYWTADRLRQPVLRDVEVDCSSESDDEIVTSEDDDDFSSLRASIMMPSRLPLLTPAGKLRMIDPNDEADSSRRDDDRINFESGFATSRCDEFLLKGPTLDVLVSGDEDGSVALLAFGQFPIGRLNGSALSQEPLFISQVFLSDNLEALAMVAGKHREAEQVIDYQLFTISTKLLNSCRREIALIASEFTFVRTELARIRSILDQAARFWEDGVISALRKLFSTLVEDEESIRATGTSDRRAVLDQLLFELLTRGVYSPTLVRFFVKATEPVLNRTFKSCDGTSDALVRLFELNCTRGLEAIIFRLGDLIGHTTTEGRFQEIGVESSLLRPLLADAENLLLATQRVCGMARDAKRNLASLEQWLIGCRRRWPGSPATNPVGAAQALSPVPFPYEDSQRVTRLILSSDLEHRQLSNELGLKKTASRLISSKPIAASWDREYVAEDDQVESDGTEMMTLSKMVNNLVIKCEEAIPYVQKALNKSFKVLNCRTLFSVKGEAFEASGRIALGFSDKSFIDIAYVTPDNSNELSILSCDTRSVDLKLTSRYANYRSPSAPIQFVKFCGGSPGRSPSLEKSFLCLLTKDLHLTVLVHGSLKGELSVVQDKKIGVQGKERVVGLSCSGPRGVACVFTNKKSFELYDIVHVDEPEEDDE